MAASTSPLSLQTLNDGAKGQTSSRNSFSIRNLILSPSSFFGSSASLIATSSQSVRTSNGQKNARKTYFAVRASSLDRIPKQFRERNLKEGLVKNFESIPSSMYGLSPSQLSMFMTEDSVLSRMGEKGGATEESITSARAYQEGGGMWSLSSLSSSPSASLSQLSMSVSMYRGGAVGYGRPKTAPPDLPSLLLDARICYLGMPIVPAVTELIVAELLWLDFDNPTKPIYFYINSPGTQNDKRESISFETEAYAIADTFNFIKSKVYTVNCGMAFGQAAMLLGLGEKGYRAMQPNSVAKLYLPKVSQSSGAAIDMWIKAKELDANTDYFLDLLSRGTGKSMEEVRKDVSRPLYLRPKEAIEYGLADKVIEGRGVAMEKKNYEEILAQSRAQRAKMAVSAARTGGAVPSAPGAGGPPGGGKGGPGGAPGRP